LGGEESGYKIISQIYNTIYPRTEPNHGPKTRNGEPSGKPQRIHPERKRKVKKGNQRSRFL